jgi:hypothetical protein
MTTHPDGLREQLLPRLRAWARHGIHIGLTPRVSPSWSGLLYREPYGGIAEYAAIFDTAMLRIGSGAAAPDVAATLDRLREQIPAGFGWTVVVEDDHMTYRFSYGHGDRNKRGERNPRFLDPCGISGTVLLLSHLDPHVRVVMLDIGPVYGTENLRAADFPDALLPCLDALPPLYRYAVRVANPEFVLPVYRESLRRRNVAHVPAGRLSDLVCRPDLLTADVCVLPSACIAEEEEGEEWMGFRETVRLCLEEGKALFAYLGDGSDAAGRRVPHGEGPGRLVRLLAGLDGELARRSPIRRRAA